MYSLVASFIQRAPKDAASSLTAISSCSRQTLVITITSVTILYVSLFFRRRYSYWRKKNVSGPKPWFLFGNFFQFLWNRQKLDLEWPIKYGRVYGIYLGLEPRLVVTDPEIMHQICIKDFDYFYDHDTSEFFNQYQKRFVFLMKGEHWKKTRALMSPTFTSGKIKRMFRFLDVCVDDLIDSIREQLDEGECGSVVNISNSYDLYTMDAITTCCYGLKLQRENCTDLKSFATRNEFVRILANILSINGPRFFISLVSPKWILRKIDFQQKEMSAYTPMVERVNLMIDARKKTEKKFDDYLQLLVDAKLDDEMELNEMDSEENHHAGLTHESLLEDQKRMSSQVRATNSGDSAKIGLDDLEIVSNAIFLLAVGLDTTSVLLTHVTYALAHHQDIQKRLYEEIMKIVQFDETKTKITFDYEAITSCRYLDAVISETLRRLTVVFSTDRVALKDYYIEKYKIHIPARTPINMNWYAVMNDPEYWEEPTKFNPERFMPENKDKIVPGSYCPFGLGPRHCVGMRFSLTEAKLALAKMVVNFKFNPTPNSSFPPPIKRAFVVTKLVKPEVLVVARK